MSSERAHALRAWATAFVSLVSFTALFGSTSGNLVAQKIDSARQSDPRRFYPDDPLWTDADTRDIPKVAEYELSKSYDFVANTFGDPVRSRGPALNVNTLGEVPDSSWFTNRLGTRALSVDEVVRGPNTVDGPAPGMWHVTGRPDAGITPKFTVKDSRGDTYLIKLDPVRFPELPSSVEVVSTKIFHAIGYHVPEDFVVTFPLSRLDVAPGARMRNPNGTRRPIQPRDVKQWLRDQPRGPDGTVRALASRFVPGKVVGQFLYVGARPDDPNDIYPHERRRELRGMRVFAAWLHHDDARSINSIDAYVENAGRHYIRHYLQDFGSNLGSGSTSAQQPRGGYEYLIEGNKILKGLASFGFWTRPWARARYPADPSVGNVEADFFEPWKWKTEYPQPAFDEMDAADAFWAASIASRFTDEMLKAIVRTGALSNAEAERYLTDVIIRRRDKVVAYWISRTNPLDRFEVRRSGSGTDLTFENAAVRLHVAQPGATYAVRWFAVDNLAGTDKPVNDEMQVAQGRVSVPDGAWGPADDAGLRYATASIRTTHPGNPQWANPVRVTVRERNGSPEVVGIERPTGREEPDSSAARRTRR
jgi:hypothetical protein